MSDPNYPDTMTTARSGTTTTWPWSRRVHARVFFSAFASSLAMDYLVEWGVPGLPLVAVVFAAVLCYCVVSYTRFVRKRRREAAREAAAR